MAPANPTASSNNGVLGRTTQPLTLPRGFCRSYARPSSHTHNRQANPLQ